MRKLIFKISVYAFLLLITLEIWVRIFHLAKDTPTRYLDAYNVEKWLPNQSGFSVTGNRKQNFSAYHINKSGFNSYREFAPTSTNFEIALVGDSFIEGFHQNYYNSIGKKIERELTGIEVYEYGYAGYDMADQLHLIHQYRAQFQFIDVVILGLKYHNDLSRSEYAVEGSRLALESPTNKLLKKSKLLVYAQSIGALSPVKDLIKKTVSLFAPNKNNRENIPLKNDDQLFNERKANLESLVNLYGFDKEKFYFLIDETITPQNFIRYLSENKFKFITIGKALNTSSKRITLMYDDHWNNNGRAVVAKEISGFIKKEYQQ